MLLVLALKNLMYYYVEEFGEHKLTGYNNFRAMLIYGEFIFYHLNCVVKKVRSVYDYLCMDGMLLLFYALFLLVKLQQNPLTQFKVSNISFSFFSCYISSHFFMSS